MLATLDVTAPLLPAARPRYLMGVGKPVDIVEAVARGIDMFDCVLPTRSGRHGQAWTDAGPINITNARFAEDNSRRSTPRAIAPPAATIRRPICIICSRPASCSAKCCSPGTTSPITKA